MEQLKPRIRQIALVSAIVTLVVFVPILLLTGVALGDVVPALLRGTLALSATAAFWIVYEKWLWRFEAFRLFGWLSPVPNLNGRWEGTVTRHKNDVPHKFVIEVVQTFSTVHFNTFSEHSSGESTAVVITKMDDANIFGIVATWRTKTRKLDDSDDYETFQGVSHWRLEYIDRPGRRHDRIKVVDDYYTDRQTVGRVEAKWVSRELHNGFEGAVRS